VPATKRRRKRVRKDAPITSGTTFHVRADEDDFEPFKAQPLAPLALVRAQKYAERYPIAVTLYVERQTLFGDPVDLFMVERDDHGVVRTYTLSHED
jgi:hypothetical protein